MKRFILLIGLVIWGGIWNYNLSGDVNHRIFADIHLESENKWLNFILMGSGLTATDLFDLQVFLWQAP